MCSCNKTIAAKKIVAPTGFKMYAGMDPEGHRFIFAAPERFSVLPSTLSDEYRFSSNKGEVLVVAFAANSPEGMEEIMKGSIASIDPKDVHVDTYGRVLAFYTMPVQIQGKPMQQGIAHWIQGPTIVGISLKTSESKPTVERCMSDMLSAIAYEASFRSDSDVKDATSSTVTILAVPDAMKSK